MARQVALSAICGVNSYPNVHHSISEDCCFLLNFFSTVRKGNAMADQTKLVERELLEGREECYLFSQSG